MHVAAAEILGADFLAGRGAHQRRAAEEDRALPFHDDVFIAHRGNIGAARGAGAHHQGDLRDAHRGHARLIVENPPKMFAIGKDLGLQRKKRAARIDQVDARQMILHRDFLRAQMLLHRERIVGPAFHGRIVGDDHRLAAGNPADAGDDRGAGRLVVIEPVSRERGQLQKGSFGIDQRFDPIAHQQLAALGVARARRFRPALANAIDSGAQFRHRGLHRGAIGLVFGAARASAGIRSCPLLLNRFESLSQNTKAAATGGVRSLQQ